MAYRIKWKQGHQEHFHEADPKGPNWVNSKFECSDFDPPTSRVIINNEVKLGLPRTEWVLTQRVMLSLLIGVVTGLFASFILIVVEKFLHWKYHMYAALFDKWYETNLRGVLYLLMLVGTLVPAMIGTALCVFWEVRLNINTIRKYLRAYFVMLFLLPVRLMFPILLKPKAAGGGLAPVIAFVNGVKVPGALSAKTLICKTFSLIFCIAGGLAAGMEAPMVHVGACVAHSLVNLRIPFTNVRPFDNLHNDADRRDFVDAGIAVGIVGAFLTPIGGCFMALEEGMTYFNVEVVFRIMLASVTCATVVNVILSLFSHHPGVLTQAHLLFFVTVKDSADATKFYGSEFPFYVIVGIFGGLSGTLFNIVQIQLIILRKKYINTKLRQMLEILVLSFLTVTLYWIIIFSTANYCIPDQHGVSDAMSDLNEVALSCPRDMFSAPAGFIMQTIPNLIRFMFEEKVRIEIPYLPLLIFTIVFHALSVCTMGAMIAGGIFIPHLCVGACWGRAFGQLLKLVTGWDWIKPHKYALLAAGAQLTGSVRVPFTIGVLMMEASGNTILGYAIFTSIIVGFIVASLFTESIYHHQCSMAGIALMDTDPPPLCSQIRADELMAKPVVTLNKIVTVDVVRNILKSTTHNKYPIVTAAGILEGAVTRSVLITMIRNKIFDGSNFNGDEAASLLAKEFPSKLNVKMIDDVPGENILNLDQYMDPSPHVVSPHTSFDTLYRLISVLGLRHIIVVDNGYKVVGIVTRKKLSCYRLHINPYHASVVKLPLR